ncbi:MAG: DUF177 domain-containing protein [Propionibacteriaceae bacterium]|nr:DUF177 domain-containing protein [Propionibacteriaceae bacterium]
MPVRVVDPRSELVVDTHELVRHAGQSKQVRRVASAPDGLGVAMIGVPPGSPVALDLRIEAVVEGVLVTGTAQVKLAGSCARCLDLVESEDSIAIQELYCYPDKELDDPDASRLEGDLIDLEPLLRDLVVIDLPFTPKCRPDCAGLCPSCGANLNRDPDHDHGADADPRWAALAGLDVGSGTPDDVADNNEE